MSLMDRDFAKYYNYIIQGLTENEKQRFLVEALPQMMEQDEEYLQHLELETRKEMLRTNPSITVTQEEMDNLFIGLSDELDNELDVTRYLDI